MGIFTRTELLLGVEGINKLKNSSIAIFGIGGVGSYTVEALARSGVGHITIFDYDKICPTNINRQLIATQKTLGKPKVNIMKDRIKEINPDARVTIYQTFYTGVQVIFHNNCRDEENRLLQTNVGNTLG